MRISDWSSDVCSSDLSPDVVPARVAALVEERKRLERDLAEAKKALAPGGGAGQAAGPEQVGGVGFLAQVVEGLDPTGLRGAVDEMKARVGSGVDRKSTRLNSRH